LKLADFFRLLDLLKGPSGSSTADLSLEASLLPPFFSIETGLPVLLGCLLPVLLACLLPLLLLGFSDASWHISLTVGIEWTASC